MSPRSRASRRRGPWRDECRSGSRGKRYCRKVTSVRATASAKINLSLRVVGVRDDGYHEIATVFHAVSLADDVTVSTAPEGTGRTVTVTGERVGDVPTGDSNIAGRAAVALARRGGLGEVDVAIEISKSIPVAAGMAGGSADAAATLVALRRLWGLRLTDAELGEVAAGIGSDVPFSLLGGTARGTGRGEVLAPVLTDGELHWVVALIDGELSTPIVYAEWDRLAGAGLVVPSSDAQAQDTPLLAALRRGEPRAVAPCLANDLQPAALALRPSLQAVLDAGEELGALAGMVSGSGPTCVFLAEDREAAIALAAELAGTGLVRGVRHAVGPAPGARLVG